MSEKLRQFSLAKRWIRRHFPLAVPLRIRLVPSYLLRDEEGTAYHGDCGLAKNGDGIEIRIANNLNTSETLSTLIHEVSHAIRMALPEMPGDTDHDEIYAAILGRIERHWLGE